MISELELRGFLAAGCRYFPVALTQSRMDREAMNFASDNTAPIAPAILDAIVKANTGFARGYGNDDWTRGVERRPSTTRGRSHSLRVAPCSALSRGRRQGLNCH